MKVAARPAIGRDTRAGSSAAASPVAAIKSDVIPPTHAGARRDNFLAMRLRVQSLATGEESFLRPKFTRPLYFLLRNRAIVLLIACVTLAGSMLPRVADAPTNSLSKGARRSLAAGCAARCNRG